MAYSTSPAVVDEEPLDQVKRPDLPGQAPLCRISCLAPVAITMFSVDLNNVMVSHFTKVKSNEVILRYGILWKSLSGPCISKPAWL